MATIELSSESYAASPGSSAIITIYRSGAAGPVSARYNTVDGSARAGVDYTATQGTLSWADGDSSARTVIIPVASTANGKSFTVLLSSVEGQAQFGDPASAVVDVSTATSASGSSSSGGGSGTKTATLSWTPPTENTNGSALTNLAGYNIYYGTSTGSMNNKISIPTVGITDYVIQNINSGTWYFAMTSVNSSGVESVLSGTVHAAL